MIDLFLPFIIGLSLGMEPAPQDTAPTDTQTAAVLPPADEGSGDGLEGRAPETDIPMGKYTTAIEVRPILGMTKSNWVAVRNYEGQDLVYFTHLLSWRCGLWDIRYGINGEPAETSFPMEPCNTDYAQPNAMIDMANFPPFITLPPNSVETIYIEITLDDGTEDFAQFNRNEILIP